MYYHIDEIRDPQDQKETPIKGIEMIHRSMTDISSPIHNGRSFLSLTQQEIEATLQPFRTKTPADQQWEANPSILRKAVEGFLQLRHDIFDEMGFKEYKLHGHQDLEKAQASFFQGVAESLKNPALSHTQKRDLETALAQRTGILRSL